MMRMDKIFAVSFIAMLAVSAANAKVVTQTNIVGGNGISVSVPVSGDNAGKVEVTNSIAPAYGTSSTADGTATKEVSIPSITDLQPGQIIVVTPSATTSAGGEKIKLNNGTAYPIWRNGAATTTTTGPYVWTKDRPAVFVFDGSHWVFIGGYDYNTNTTYSAMSVSEGRTGTATSARSMRADYLKQIVQGTDAAGGNGLAQGAKLGDGYAKASSASDVTKSDTIREAIGKLEKKADDAAAAASAAADAQVNADWNATSGKAQILNKPTLGSLAAKSTITNTDVASNAAIADSKIARTGTITSGNTNIPTGGAVYTAVNAKADKATTLAGYGITDAYTKTQTDTALEAKQDIQIGAAKSGTTASTDSGKAVIVDENGKIAMSSATLKAVATSGSYDDLSNKPTIPTVNNATLTIQKNGTTVKTFTANASSNVTANITVPTQPSDIGAAAASHNHASSDVNAMTGYAKASTAAAIATSDTLNQAIGKLEKALDGKQASGDYVAANSAITASGTTNKIVQYDSKGLVVAGTTAGALATKSTISNSDVASGAAIADSKIARTGTITSGNTNIPTGGAVYTAVSAKQDKLDATASTGNIKGTNGVTVTTPTTGDDAGKVVVSGPTLATVATSGSYDDLSNKPTIPTVNNATLTIQKNGTTVKTFTANASSNVTANITVPTQPSDIGAAAASHNHASSDVNAMTGYAKASTAAAIATSDTLNQAIGKLEKALDGKQASGDYAAASHTHATNEVTALTGYSKGTASSALATGDTLNQALSKLENQVDKKVTTAQGSGAANKAVITNSSGNITTGTITSGMITDGTIANADIASNAAIAVSKISGAQTTANMVTATDGYNAAISDTTKYPNVAVVNQMIGDSQVGLTSRVAAVETGKIDKTVAADANAVMVRGTGGTYVKGTGTDVSVANDGAITVNHATSANSIPNGSENATTYATIWVE